MTKIDVFCAIPGAANGFRIKIEHDATVGELQEAIYTYKRYKERFPDRDAFAADEMTLFLAKEKDGGWVAHDKTLQARLQDEIDVAKLTQMDPLWKLNDERCFGANAPFPRRTIQVVVLLPPIKDDDDDSSTDDDGSRKRKYAHSEVGSTEGRELLEYLSIRMETVPTVARADQTQGTDAFKWKSVNDEDQLKSAAISKEAQRGHYQAYMEANLESVLTSEKLCVMDVPEALKVLTIGVGDVQFCGQPDLLILSDRVKDDPSRLQWLTDVRMLVQVKRDVDPSADFQGLSELIALDLLAKNPVVALVTDLASNWWFFWVAETNTDSAVVHKAMISDPGEAFQVVRTLLSKTPSPDESVQIPSIERPMKRRKLSYLKGTAGDPSAVCEAIERYYDIASVLGPNLDLAMEVGRLLVQTIPSFHFQSR